MTHLVQWINDNWLAVAIPASVFLAFWVGGLWLRRIAFDAFNQWLIKTKWEPRQLFIDKTHTPFLHWFLLLGTHISIQVSALPPDAKTIAGKILASLFVFSLTWVAVSLSEKSRQEQKLNEVVEHQIESRAKKNFDKAYQEIGLSRRMVEAISAHIRDAVLGQPEDLTNFDFPKISEDEESDAVKLVKEMLDEASTWKELDDLSRLWTELERVRRALSDELAVIILRKIVPGRCRYCPL